MQCIALDRQKLQNRWHTLISNTYQIWRQFQLRLAMLHLVNFAVEKSVVERKELSEKQETVKPLSGSCMINSNATGNNNTTVLWRMFVKFIAKLLHKNMTPVASVSCACACVCVWWFQRVESSGGWTALLEESSDTRHVRSWLAPCAGELFEFKQFEYSEHP